MRSVLILLLFVAHCYAAGETDCFPSPSAKFERDIRLATAVESDSDFKDLTHMAYLKQFVGVYEIYGYCLEIVIQQDSLYALIPSQPVYELIPTTKNEFTVKSLSGYTVRFLMNQDQKVDELLIVQPKGTFSVKPRR